MEERPRHLPSKVRGAQPGLRRAQTQVSRGRAPRSWRVQAGVRGRTAGRHLVTKSCRPRQPRGLQKSCRLVRFTDFRLRRRRALRIRPAAATPPSARADSSSPDRQSVKVRPRGSTEGPPRPRCVQLKHPGWTLSLRTPPPTGTPPPQRTWASRSRSAGRRHWQAGRPKAKTSLPGGQPAGSPGQDPKGG